MAPDTGQRGGALFVEQTKLHFWVDEYGESDLLFDCIDSSVNRHGGMLLARPVSCSKVSYGKEVGLELARQEHIQGW